MPLTDKGREILGKMEQEYGAKKGEWVFYASANKGTITGVHDAMEQSKLDAVMGMCQAYDQKDASVAVQFKAREIVELMLKRGYTTNQIITKIRDGYEVPQSMDPERVVAEAYKVLKAKERLDAAEATQLDDLTAFCNEYDKK